MLLSHDLITISFAYHFSEHADSLQPRNLTLANLHVGARKGLGMIIRVAKVHICPRVSANCL